MKQSTRGQLAALILGFATCGFASAQWDVAPSGPNLTPYSDPAGHFAIMVPTSWQSEIKPDSTVFRGDGAALTVASRQRTTDTAGESKSMAGRVSGIASNYREDGATSGLTAGKPSRTTDFEATGPHGEATKGRIVSVTNGTDTLTFVLTAPSAEFAADAERTNRILDTLTFDVPAPSGAAPVALRERTPVKVDIIETLSSGSAKRGEIVRYEVAEEVLSANHEVLIPKGAPAYGVVTRASHRGIFGKPGKLDFTIDTVNAIDGAKVPLRSNEDMNVKGKNNSGAAVATAILLAPVALLVNGRDVNVKKGSEFTVYVDQDTMVNASKRVAPSGP